MTKSTELKLLPNQEFHKYVGYCITAWAKVDEHLFDTFQETLQPSSREAAWCFLMTAKVYLNRDSPDVDCSRIASLDSL